MWARVGLKARLVSEGFSTFIAKMQNFEFPAHLLGWGVATYDAQY